MTADLRVRVCLPPGQRRADIGPGWTDLWARDGCQPDLDAIEDVWVNDVYGLRGLPTETWDREREDGGATVVDIGANIGAFTCAALRYGAAHVMAVEPDPTNLALLARNVEQMGGQFSHYVSVISAAVGSERGTARVFGDAANAHTEPESAEGGTPVEQISLADVLDRVNGRIGFLKLDCEGAEYAAFADPALDLTRVERISLELHGPETCPWVTDVERCYGDLMAKLAETHAVNAFGYPRRGGMIFAHRYDEDG